MKPNVWSKYNTKYDNRYIDTDTYLWYKNKYGDLTGSEYLNVIDRLYKEMEIGEQELLNGYNVPFTEITDEKLNGKLVKTREMDTESKEYNEFIETYSYWCIEILKTINCFKKVYNESLFFSKII